MEEYKEIVIWIFGAMGSIIVVLLSTLTTIAWYNNKNQREFNVQNQIEHRLIDLRLQKGSSLLESNGKAIIMNSEALAELDKRVDKHDVRIEVIEVKQKTG